MLVGWETTPGPLKCYKTATVETLLEDYFAAPEQRFNKYIAAIVSVHANIGFVSLSQSRFDLWSWIL